MGLDMIPVNAHNRPSGDWVPSYSTLTKTRAGAGTYGPAPASSWPAMDSEDRMPTNWARNVTFRPGSVAVPVSVDEMSELIRGVDKARVVGSAHSFSPLVATAGTLVSTARLTSIEWDGDVGLVRIGAGVTYEQLTRWLANRGRGLTNLASLPHITVAGAVATASHGSGPQNPSLASAVRALELVTADGSLVRFDDGDERWSGIVVSLGSFGVVTSLTLETVPDFEIAQWVFEALPWNVAESSLIELLALGYSTSLFLSWSGSAVEQLWVKSRTPLEADVPGMPAVNSRHPFPRADPAGCTEQLGRPGPSAQRLPHFRLEGIPRAGEELQSEWLVAAADAQAVFCVLRELSPEFSSILRVSEVRVVAADRFWLSPFYDRPSVAFHFTWKLSPDVWMAIARIEQALAPYEPRPHWGKLFSVTADAVSERYPRFSDFRVLRQQLDPNGAFVNSFLEDLGLFEAVSGRSTLRP